VRPPLFEGVTPEEVAEIGEFATKYGFTPFDIFNQYESEDQMMDRDGLGCARYTDIRNILKDSAEYKQLKETVA
jgi:hypothetical protein